MIHVKVRYIYCALYFYYYYLVIYNEIIVQLRISSSDFRLSQGARNLDPLHAQFTAGLELL